LVRQFLHFKQSSAAGDNDNDTSPHISHLKSLFETRLISQEIPNHGGSGTSANEFRTDDLTSLPKAFSLSRHRTDHDIHKQCLNHHNNDHQRRNNHNHNHNHHRRTTRQKDETDPPQTATSATPSRPLDVQIRTATSNRHDLQHLV
jgi:hypothetical protein